jgi:hypothetical protein
MMMMKVIHKINNIWTNILKLIIKSNQSINNLKTLIKNNLLWKIKNIFIIFSLEGKTMDVRGKKKIIALIGMLLINSFDGN